MLHLRLELEFLLTLDTHTQKVDKCWISHLILLLPLFSVLLPRNGWRGRESFCLLSLGHAIGSSEGNTLLFRTMMMIKKHSTVQLDVDTCMYYYYYVGILNGTIILLFLFFLYPPQCMRWLSHLTLAIVLGYVVIVINPCTGATLLGQIKVSARLGVSSRDL